MLGLCLQLDDEREKDEDRKIMEELENFEDEFMKEYRQKRIEEMRLALQNVSVGIL
jgi:hypothetical protein